MTFLKQFSLVSLFAMSLLGCGGGGEGGPFRGSGSSFTGNLNPATASPENVTELVIAAGEATKRAAKQSVAPRDLLSSSGSISSTCGGSLNAIVLDGQSEGSFTYNNFCLGADETRVIVNGTVLFASAGNADIFGDAGNRMTFTYGDLKMDFATTNFVLNMFARCNGSLGSLVDCEYNEDFRGENNIVYKSIDTTVSGNNTAGRRIEGTVADSVQGAVLFVASDIIICDNFNIGAGNIAINDSTGTTVIDVVFSDDCATMDITYAGLTETVSQI